MHFFSYRRVGVRQWGAQCILVDNRGKLDTRFLFCIKELCYGNVYRRVEFHPVKPEVDSQFKLVDER